MDRVFVTATGRIIDTDPGYTPAVLTPERAAELEAEGARRERARLVDIERALMAASADLRVAERYGDEYAAREANNEIDRLCRAQWAQAGR